MGFITLAKAIIEGDCLVDEGADAITYLAAHSGKGNAKILIKDGNAHSYVRALTDISERPCGAGVDAGEVFAETAGLVSCRNARCANCNTALVTSRREGLIRAGKNAFSALYATR